MTKTVCKVNACTGCMACAQVCSKGAITIIDEKKAYNAIIDSDLCVGCGLCTKVCPNNTPVKLTTPIDWKQGWATDEDERMKSSSGGFARAITKAFISRGGIVWSCELSQGVFRFGQASNVEEAEKFRGSMYVKSNPENVYKSIKKQLVQGKRVLFIGLPCQVAGLKNYVGTLDANLFTIDLICHGTPSPILLKEYLNKKFGIKLDELRTISFRTKDNFRMSTERKALIHKRVQDRYTIAFLSALDYTENCYSCRYAQLDRASDLTLGDAWGSNEQEEERKKGISLALCQTEKGQELLNISEIKIAPIELGDAINSNHQLAHPSVAPASRNRFWRIYSLTGNFSLAVSLSIVQKCVRQDIKSILLKSRVIHGGGK